MAGLFFPLLKRFSNPFTFSNLFIIMRAAHSSQGPLQHPWGSSVSQLQHEEQSYRNLHLESSCSACNQSFHKNRQEVKSFSYRSI